MRGQYAGLVGRFEYDCAGAITEQHTGVAVFPVDESRQALGADDQRTFRFARPNELVRSRQRIQETRASGFQSDRRTGGNSETMLN